MGDQENENRNRETDDGEDQSVGEQFNQVVDNLQQMHAVFSSQSTSGSNPSKNPFDELKGLSLKFSDDKKEKKGKKLLRSIQEHLSETTSISLRLKLLKAGETDPNTERNATGEASLGPGITKIKNMLKDLKGLPEDQALAQLEKILTQTEKLKAKSERVLLQSQNDEYIGKESERIKKEEKVIERADQRSYLSYTKVPYAFENVVEPTQELKQQPSDQSLTAPEKLEPEKQSLRPPPPKPRPPGEEQDKK